MRLVPQVAAERRTCLKLEAFETAAIAERLGGRHYADRRDKTLFMELVDLRLRQDFGHGHCASDVRPLHYAGSPSGRSSACCLRPETTPLARRIPPRDDGFPEERA